MQKLKFPQGFLWGTANSAYQTEGGNIYSDWYKWEKSLGRQGVLESAGKKPEDFMSGQACDFYNRYEEDFALAKSLNHNSIRIGIEWARVEPKEGEFDQHVLDHYEKMLQSARFNGLKVFLTLHHYTNPVWFAEKRAFEKKENIQFFLRYVEVIAKRFGEEVDFWLTFNEPEVYVSFSYFLGLYPPQEKSFFKSFRVLQNLISAHNRSYKILRMHSQKPVSMAFHLSDIQAVNIFSEPITYLAHYLANEYILNRTIDFCDFVGVNYYFHHHVGWLGKRRKSHSGHEQTDLGWGIHPEGLERVLLSLKKYKKPVYITENGIADRHDKKREKFIKDHLYFVHKAIKQGVNVKGYLYWSLTDNFEWLMGFGPRFGLVEIDREGLLKRKVRYSALKFGEICGSNEMVYEPDASLSAHRS
ncbi:MAG: glycoside hydrolase family 1 protein [Candidatus Doudnabacteria bacterium]|nr:glycoside hydrolase family 1 protein [Candidatus Doudnabacteria bacterium]